MACSSQQSIENVYHCKSSAGSESLKDWYGLSVSESATFLDVYDIVRLDECDVVNEVFVGTKTDRIACDCLLRVSEVVSTLGQFVEFAVGIAEKNKEGMACV